MKIIQITLIASIPSISCAQDIEATRNFPSITSTAEAPIRTSPPSGFFNVPGDATGTTEIGERYRVTNSIEVQRFFGTDVWVQVTPEEGTANQGEEFSSGWVYWGEAGNENTTGRTGTLGQTGSNNFSRDWDGMNSDWNSMNSGWN